MATKQHFALGERFAKRAGIRLSELLLLSGFYCYAYIFFNRLFFSPSEPTAFHPTFIQVVLALAAFVVLVFPRHLSCKPVGRKLIGLIAILFSLGILFGFAGISDTPFAGLTTRLLGIVFFGTAFVMYTILWARVYERLSPPVALLAITLSVLFSTIVRSVTYTDLHGNLFFGALLIALICLSLATLRRCSTPSHTPPSADPYREMPDQPIKDVFFGETKEPLFAAFSVGVGIGLVWGENSSFNYNVPFSMVAVCIVAALVCYLVLVKKRSPFVYYVLYRVVFPLAALLLLASLFLIVPGTPMFTEQVFSFAYYLAISFFEVAIMASLITTARLNDVSSTRAIAAKFLVYGTGFLVGKALLLTMGPDIANTALGVTLIAYLAASITLLSKNLFSASQDSKESLQEKIVRRAEIQYGLTSRETDILDGLLEGRTYEGIARTLFISSSTVKTHVKHIYGKTGVGTRDELIDLLTRQRRP